MFNFMSLTLVYLWVLGGAFVAADYVEHCAENYSISAKHWEVALIVALWPFLLTYGAVAALYAQVRR